MFIYNLEDIAKKLKIDFDGITKQIEHNGVKGSAREDLLKDYLKKLLPEKYSISSGIIIDNNQNQSKQQDFIIHDAFNCPSFFKTDSNSILPIESVYATVEIKSTLDYSTLEQSVKNIESVRKLDKLPNRNVIRNLYDNVYPLGFVFAYSSNYSLEQIQKRLFELNKSVDGRHQISIICVLDKGLIFNVQKNNVIDVTLIPSNETLLARSDSGLENTLYSFYLFLLEYLDNVHIQVPSLIEYARKNNSFKVSINIPNELIPDDAVYKEGLIELKYGDARKILNLNNKYPNLFNGKMTYEEMFNYLKDDFIPLCKIQAQMAKVKFHNKITIYGYVFTPETFSEFEKYAFEYNNNTEYKNKFDKIVEEIYLDYKKRSGEQKMIRIEENKIQVDDFNYLTDKVGWGTRDANVVEEALNNTLYSVSIYDDNKIIGYGRIIGDKTIFLYIQDIMVVPEYQGQKIGTKIMNALLTKVDEYKKINPNIRTYLGASKGKEKFYEKFGFKTRSNADLGEGMVLF